jgi:hypothetical protein
MNRIKNWGGRTLALLVGVAFVTYHLSQIAGGVVDLVRIPTQTGSNVTVLANASPTKASILGFQADQSIWPTRVIATSVGLDLPLTGSIEKSGAWLISETGGNFATNTAVPNGQTGNTALFGHDRSKLFHPIHDLKVGSEIKVLTKTMVY